MELKKKLIPSAVCVFIFGAFGALGYDCFGFLCFVSALNKERNYPYLYPFSIAAGLVSLIICIAAFIRNISFLSRLESRKRIISFVVGELLMTFAVFIMFWIIWDYLIFFLR